MLLYVITGLMLYVIVKSKLVGELLSDTLKTIFIIVFLPLAIILRIIRFAKVSYTKTQKRKVRKAKRTTKKSETDRQFEEEFKQLLQKYNKTSV